VTAALAKLGHTLDKAACQGDAHTIWIDPKVFLDASTAKVQDLADTTV